MGFTDLHDHLLWDIDDGAATPEESLDLARALAERGWTDVAATPHARPEFPDANAVAARRREAAALFGDAGLSLALHPGAENVLEPDYLARLEQGDGRGLGEQGRWVLLEAPFRQPAPYLLDVVFRVRVKGKRALLAHPERCMEFVERPERARQVVELGAALQIELFSFAGAYGKPARELAHRLVGEGLAHVVATDLHHAAQIPLLDPALAALHKVAGAAYATRLLADNPCAILRGEDLT